jgi:drug/metabolite transporter (DMT)-like permease
MKKYRFVFLFLGFLLYSFIGVVGKLGSESSMLSIQTLFRFAAVITLLGVYSVLWQVSLRYIPLSTAFFCKGSAVVFSLVWAVIVFGETITASNLIGVCLIIAGIVLMAYERRVA